MTLLHVGGFALAALGAGLIRRPHLRAWLVTLASVIALFWLQPSTPIRQLDFWLPVLTLTLVLSVWVVTQTDTRAASWPSALGVAGLVLLLALTRYAGPLCCLTASRPPPILTVAGGVIAAGLLQVGVGRTPPGSRGVSWALAGLLLGALIVVKTPALAQTASSLLRSLAGQSSEQASALDLRWLGISYVVFRLIGVLRDRQAGLLRGDLTPPQFVSYALFFPALAAGPIHRAETFAPDLRAERRIDAGDFAQGGWRIAVGLFKKFALADTLALFALNDARAGQTDSTLWLWVMLYAYAWRIYWDFAGYTDIAIGLGRWAGIRLPENFDRPYLKNGLTAFWNGWHMSLAGWFRSYWFNPLTRSLRARARSVSPAALIALGQITTMTLIGLWHGVTLNFVIWGVWHGVGLFLDNRWAALTRSWSRRLENRPWALRALQMGGTLATFHFVALGWVWFALAETPAAWRVFGRLLGL